MLVLAFLSPQLLSKSQSADSLPPLSHSQASFMASELLKKALTSSLVASLMAQRVKNLPAMWETRVRFLGQEDPLEESLASHSSILAWRVPWTGGPGGLQSVESQRVRQD